MENEHGQINFVETDDGYRIEVKGKHLKDAIRCFALPTACCDPGSSPAGESGKTARTDCCGPEKEE